jgi:hypothetical protein
VYSLRTRQRTILRVYFVGARPAISSRHFSRHFSRRFSPRVLIYSRVSGRTQKPQQFSSDTTTELSSICAAAVEISPRRRANHGSTGFVYVHLRPRGHFAAKIFAAGVRVWLCNFNTREEAACAYDAAAWRFARPRHQMNFPEVGSLAEAESLVPEPHFVS